MFFVVAVVVIMNEYLLLLLVLTILSEVSFSCNSTLTIMCFILVAFRKEASSHTLKLITMVSERFCVLWRAVVKDLLIRCVGQCRQRNKG